MLQRLQQPLLLADRDFECRGLWTSQFGSVAGAITGGVW